MLDYLNAEFYKVTHRRGYLLGMLGFLFGGGALLLFLLRFATGEAQNTVEVAVGILMMALSVGIYLALMVCDLVFSDQYKLNTLKNEMSYGIPRGRVYLGKLAAAIVTAVVICLLMVAFYLVLALLFFPMEGKLTDLLSALGKALAGVLPIWLGALGLGLMLLFATKGSTIATVIFVLLMGPLDSVLQLLEMFVPKLFEVIEAIRPWLLGNGLNGLIMEGTLKLSYTWPLGMAWLLATTAIGFIAFQKREIN